MFQSFGGHLSFYLPLPTFAIFQLLWIAEWNIGPFYLCPVMFYLPLNEFPLLPLFSIAIRQ